MQNHTLDRYADYTGQLSTVNEEICRLFLSVAEAKEKQRSALLRQAAARSWGRRREDDAPARALMELSF